jgi:hypothetical protein
VLGETLDGQRTYFYRPVAYDNQRLPVIPAQIRPLPLTAAGLGESMPEGWVPRVPQPNGTPASLTYVILAIAAVLGFSLLKGSR